ncbi:dynein heavy chain 12, axonemal [Drosophila persimilis]|uniref:dynein heavy chain 12, axonemal n=1 Tax=Drosophila persimilis TaxID=7234 RepID=UPI000F085552|nr:dynein heavy chain 12, axonemal [Drosophila persimilis]
MYSRKLSRMHRPPSDTRKYDNEPYLKNPLLKFHISEVHERRHYQFLKQKAADVKVRIARQSWHPEPDIRPLPQSHYVDNLRREVRKIIVPPMLRKTEAKILSFASERLRRRYPEMVDSYMKDVHEEFNRLMKIYSMKNILRHPEFSDEDPSNFELPHADIHFKRPGRTGNYSVYLENRRKIGLKLLILQLPMRAVLNISVSDLPNVVCIFKYVSATGAQQQQMGLCGREALSYKFYRKYIQNQLDKVNTFLRWTWYPKLVIVLRKMLRKRVMPPALWKRAWSGLEGLMNRELNNMKMRTFIEMFRICSDPRTMPMFRMSLEWTETSGDLDTRPNLFSILRTFAEIATEISMVGYRMEPLQPQVETLTTMAAYAKVSDYLKIEMNDNSLKDVIDNVQKIIIATYDEVTQFIENFRSKYHALFSWEEREALNIFLAEPHEFEEYFARIDIYYEFINMLRSEPATEYFVMAIIHNEPAIQGLRNLAENLIAEITVIIIREHIKAEEEICEEFEKIKYRALEIPKSTEELLESADYMIHVKTVKLAELTDRIHYCLQVGTNIVELREMSKYHFDLTIKTITWIKVINEICEYNASQQEQFKFLFEEHLQEVVKKLNTDIEEMLPKLAIIDDMSRPEKFRDSYIILQNFIDQLKTFDDYVAWINKEEKLFKVAQTEYPTLEVIKSFVYPFAELMKCCIDWQRYLNVWRDGPFEYLEPKFVESTTDNYLKEFQKNQKYYRVKIKQDLIDNPVCKFKGQTEDPDPAKHPVPLRLCTSMIQSIKDFTTGVFVVNIMCNPALRKRHWKEMSEIAGFDVTPDAGTTLRKILDSGLDSILDQFEIISISANKELQLWNALQAMIKEWENKVFPTGPYKETGVTILNSLDDIQALLDDHILKTLTMRGSAFMKPCEEEVRAWYEKIMRVNETLDQWGKVQANYLYLLPIFSSKDIVAQMPEEGRLFTIVEQTYTRNMGLVLRQPLVMETAPASGLLESLQKANELLEDISTGVSNYLEKKRLFFPRFFFLANDEMLEILSETKDPLRVLPHLSKCFEGINSLEFDSSKNVLAMISSDKEHIEFIEPVSTMAAGGSVEKWLIGVEDEMLKAVRNQNELSFGHYPKVKRHEWVLEWPQMVVLAISQVYWAAKMHGCLRRTFGTNQAVMANFFQELSKELNDIVALVRSPVISNLNRITIKSLIVIDVHAKDVTEELIRLKINSEYDFQWLAQMRYYWEDEKTLVRIINATVPFANEYLGNSDRLVITPLTDRCYRTLVGAYQLHLNGAPEGPAGTGKTETTKDLAKALAVQCKVFNCSDGLDYKAMGKFFKGLASCGAWACFDEFNRIELEVLSVVAQQILLIIQAVRANVSKFMFEGTELMLNPAVYVCITMNPGYAGRSELPDNLKVLFRSVAMMVPDYAMIGEISLYSYGFVDARKLAVKIVTTYRLCSEQLSSQNHYDYGMRAVKTVLSACGNIKKQYPDELEDILLLRSLIDVNLPKFLSFDVPLFEGIISDIFPGISLPHIDYSLFETEFKRVCLEEVLEPAPSFLTKVIQTYEMIIVRHGFMLVGEPLAGKSKTLQVLSKVMSALKIKAPQKSSYFQHVLMGIMNPKSITMNQLYGSFDPISYEWTDGLVAKIFREFAMTPTPDRKWVIFDGPVDAVWIENMNTVLDDNKKLCLTSGEVITMSHEMSMIFEVMDLAQASPATVSRCGMIYMEPSTLGWRAFANSWLKKADPRWADEEGVEYVSAMLQWLLPQCQTFVRRNCSQFVRSGEFNCMLTTFDLIDMLLDEAIEENPEDYQKYIVGYFQAAILFALAWGVGGILDTASRDKFDAFLRKIYDGEEANPPEFLGKMEVTPPVEGLLVEYVYVFKQRGTWRYWPELAKRMDVEETKTGVIVPTVDTGRYVHLLKMHVKHKKRMLLVGPTGTGKSVYVQNYLMNKLNQEEYESGFITFTVMITANQCQELLISKLQKWKRGIYGPPKGMQSVLFVDDMNMPVKEVYGAQPPLELLRQYFDYGHVYDLKDASKLYIHDVLIMAACGLPGGSRQDVYARFLNHFNVFSINTFSDDSMFRIFLNVALSGFRRSGHGQDVFLVTNQIVSATQSIYKSVQSEVRATPAKSHYVFNLRDISRVVTGCTLVRKESVNDKKVLVRVWYHEAMRVFFDRLVDDTDRKWMFDKLNDCLKANFKDKVENIFDKYCVQVGDEQVFSMETANNVFFGVYFDEDSVPDERRYEEVPSVEVFLKVALDSLDDYNSTRRSKMDITLFTFALQHLNRICRIISIQGASALLIGLGGSGRQSLTKLATNMVQTSFFQPEITKNYGANDWHDDIKVILKEAGGMNKHTTFLITENQIKMELFLQDIDCLLNQGEVPNIFPIDEKQEVLEMVRLAAQGGNRNIDVSPLQVFSFFVNRCKQKLHIVLSFSPIGDALRTRVRLYPSLVNCCTIDWYDSWPEEALQMIARMSLVDVNVPSEEIKMAIVDTCQYFHTTAARATRAFCQLSGRHIYQTNASFIELIRSFQTLIDLKQSETMFAKMRYIGGLDTLANAAAAISIMQRDLNALQPKLVALAEASRKMMLEINKETLAASAAAEQVKRDEEVASVQAVAAQVLKNECEKDLAKAIPVLEDALAALNTLKPADITLVKSMKNPPSVIKLVMAAVCVIKAIPADRVPDPSSGKMVQDYWGPSKRLLGEMNFLPALKEFDKDNIPVEIMKRIRKEFIPNKDFDPKVVAKASSAAKGLCQWIIAMDMYDDVAKVVAPKKAKLAGAEKEYADTMSFLAEKRALAAALEEKVALLNIELDKANEEMKKTEEHAENCRNKLLRAEALIGGLGGEKSRWNKAADDLQELYDHLPGDVLLSCGIIAYLSAVNLQSRTECVNDWFQKVTKLKIPCSKKYSITEVLGLEVTIQNWQLDGLPNDEFSSENAIIVSSSSRYSLFIDPQGQANNWLKNMERKNRLNCVKFNQGNYMRIIAEAMEYGTPVIIENVQEELEVPLDPILMHQTFIQGGVKHISLGEAVVPLSPNFRLYMTCNLRNPHFLPETFNKVTVINFALTQNALMDQLLSIVVAKERPDLQELRITLTTEAAANKGALRDAENLILKTLSASEGDILENEAAIQILGESKGLSKDIQEKQEAAKETSAKIEAFRLNYKPVAVHSSILYYSITDLPNIDPMYQFSLNWYINLYMYSIDTANKSKDLPRRIKFLVDGFTKNLYNNVCRSIFEKDKLLFSFILTARVLLGTGQVEMRHLAHLVTNAKESSHMPPNPDHSWITETVWLNVLRLEELKELRGIVDAFRKNLSAWQAIYDHASPELQPLPAPWNDKTTAFEKIIVLKALRPDSVFLAVRNFIALTIGDQFVSPPEFDISKSYADSTALTPLVFILSPGADPLGSLLAFAEKMGQEETFQSISLGQGQGPIATALIKSAQEMGYWVCLQNCHLAASWMPALEYMWENMDTFNTVPNFRLWLTAYPTPQFPVTILQNGVKMTNEPPTGLRENLMRSYNSEPINEYEFYAGCAKQDRAFTRLLYGICFFHAVVQERRKYGPLGWNIAYGFNESDLQISVLQLSMLLNQYEHVPYDAISYLTSECNYGGRVTDNWDRRAIVTILADFCNPQVVADNRYRFATDDRYILPRKMEHREMLRYLEDNIPSLAPPEVYGLHANSGITRDLQTTKTLLDSMILLLGSEAAGTAGAGVSAEQIILNTIKQIGEDMPADMDIEAAAEKYPVDYNESMNTVVVQEMERFLKLQKEIRASCRDLAMGIKGIIVMTPDLENVMTAMKFNRIPLKWMSKSYPSLKPLGSYVQDLYKRLNWLFHWYMHGKPPTFWLSGFFFTQAFLTGAMQNFARKYKIPIDTLTFDYDVLKVETKATPPDDGVYCNGLFVEGARWDWEHNMLVEQYPKILIYIMPVIFFRPVLILDLVEGTRYKCPLYKTGERKGTLSTTGHSTNYVVPLLLNTQAKPSHWVKRSVALICQTND